MISAVILPGAALSQIIPNGLSTRVNGSALGTCRAGRCSINGGVKAGNNLFYRFGNFDTRHGITEIFVDTRKQENIIFGIAGRQGLLLNKDLRLSSTANIFMLSPGGIWIGSGASFINASNLLLSTSSGMNIGKSRFDLLAATISRTKNLDGSPNIDLKALRNPLVNLADLGLAGNGLITVDGGRITVDRHLLMDAHSSAIRSTGHESTIAAGESVHLVASDIDLKSTRVLAGSGPSLGRIQIQSSSGNISLDKVNLKARDIRISGGKIALTGSSLFAPTGNIEMKASNALGKESNLTISRSNLDVSLPGFFRENERVNSDEIPRIALSSEGSITIRQSQLNIASDRTASQHQIDGKPADLPLLKSRSGIIFMRAKNNITLDASHLNADGQHEQAGQIYALVDGGDGKGGIKINQSRLSASHGMGGGVIDLASNSGIKINESEVVTSSNNFPIINGSSSGTFVVNGKIELRPFSFRGGQIILSNTSEKEGISIDRSKFLAIKTNSGSGIDIRISEYSDRETDDLFVKDTVFSLGHELPSGGLIRIRSKGGVSIRDNSLIEASSRQENGMIRDAIAGTIGIANSGNRSIIIDNSSLEAKSAPARDFLSQNQTAGTVTIFNESAIAIANSRINVSAYTNRNRHFPLFPTVIIQSCDDCLSFSDHSFIDARVRFANTGNSTGTGYINLYGLPAGERPVNLKTKPVFSTYKYPVNAIDYSKNFESLATWSQDQAVESLGNRWSLTQPPPTSTTSFPAVSLLRQPQSLIPAMQTSSGAVTITNNLEENLKETALLEWQKRSLESTLKRLGLSTEKVKLRSIAELQKRLSDAKDLFTMAPLQPPGIQAHSSILHSSQHAYAPAILNLQRNDQPNGTTRVTATLLTAQGEPISSGSNLSRKDFDGWIRGFQRQLSRRAAPRHSAARDPARQLSQILIEPLLPKLRQQGITALLIEADRGLQAIPYAALPVAGRPLAETFALTITPALGLIDLDPPQRTERSPAGQMLLAGASAFSNGLEPLPMVRQELITLAAEHPATTLLDEAFTPTALVNQAQAPWVRQLHIATHATFQPGQSSKGLLFTPKAALSLEELGRGLRSRPSASPLHLISLSGCVTALGDEQSELGFVGMALQAGARSGLGTLWEVDDAASAAFFIQFYRHLKLGLSKDQALQATQRAFLNGEVRLRGDQLIGPDPAAGYTRTPLVSGLARERQTLFAQGLDHPYYWAGMVLSGSPW
ncbi:MAG: CHAT domain-containing protein [Cyanobacteriota bacterium]|nr:CHAT domain-containing protein [Cyanobacteriota bacterium]